MSTEQKPEGYKIKQSSIQKGQRIRLVKSDVDVDISHEGVVSDVVTETFARRVHFGNRSGFSVALSFDHDVYLLSHRSAGEPKEPLTRVTWAVPPDAEGNVGALFIAVKTSWDYWEVLEFNTSEYSAYSTEMTWDKMCAMIAGNDYTINEAPEVLRKKEGAE